jgi:hypothetical protein
MKRSASPLEIVGESGDSKQSRQGWVVGGLVGNIMPVLVHIDVVCWLCVGAGVCVCVCVCVHVPRFDLIIYNPTPLLLLHHQSERRDTIITSSHTYLSILFTHTHAYKKPQQRRRQEDPLENNAGLEHEKG